MRPKYKKWSSQDKAALKLLWQTGTQDQIMSVLPDRSWSSIREMAHYLNLSGRVVRYKWLAIAAQHKSTLFRRSFM